MRNNSRDETLKTNYIQTYQFLIKEYEEVKEGKHTSYRYVKEFYKAHGTCAQTFLKYYNRYKQNKREAACLLPGKRGPKYKTRRADKEIEELVLREREKGSNKYEISSLLRCRVEERGPSPSGVYTILKRYGKNRLSRPMQEEKRRIIKEAAGELGHIDCHHLARDAIAGERKRYYIVCVIDSYSRIAWAEVIGDIKALSVMFATLYCFNYIQEKFGIRFKEALTDNGPEFGSKGLTCKAHHPFERLLMELEVKHRYSRPYRPQTNGKVERFWRTLKADLIDGTYFESISQFREELLGYMLYYNQLRPHQALNGLSPERFLFHQRIM